MPEEHDKLFHEPPEPKPASERPDLDMDYFHPEGPARPIPEPSFQDNIPEDVQDQLRPRREAFERRFEQLDHAGMPEAEKQAILRREFPEFRSPEDIERDELAGARDVRLKSPPAKPRKRHPRSRDWIQSDAGPRVEIGNKLVNAQDPDISAESSEAAKRIMQDTLDDRADHH